VSTEVVVESTPALAEVFAQRVAQADAEAIATRGSFSIALSGGSVATGFFRRLAALPLDRFRLDVFWADERAVPPDHADSNYHLARSLWLGPARIPDARVHRMRGEASDLDEAARAYEDELRQVLGDPPQIDVALLGVGPDGHVASLFPGHRLLGETVRQVAALDDAPKPPPRRLTLTLSALAAARLVVVAAFGSGKAEVVRDALEDAASTLPVAQVARRAPRTLFLLDPEAAALRR
jgi:6-phosphogluconolactonase